MDSAEVIKELVRGNSGIKACRFFSFSTSTKLQDRLQAMDDHECDLISRAQEKKKRESVRFWNALLSVFIEGRVHNEELLAEVFYHQPNRDFTYVDRKDLEEFLATKKAIPQAVNSKVLMIDGSSRHIPLLDFKVPSKQGHDRLVADCVRAMGLHGYVLDSGRSYHFIGSNLISESELLDLLAKFVLLDPISDKAWAAHQIIERSASLRVSEVRGRAPMVVSQV